MDRKKLERLNKVLCNLDGEKGKRMVQEEKVGKKETKSAREKKTLQTTKHSCDVNGGGGVWGAFLAETRGEKAETRETTRF